ncbi:MAG: peptidoglycan-binding protein [Phenylobacterium sp.]
MPEEIASEEQITARLPRAFFETPTHVMPSPIPSAQPPGSSPDEPAPGDLGRIAQALDRLTDRIEASETRTGLAISGVEHSVRHAMARIETAEREQIAVASRYDAAAERLEVEQSRASERLRQIENEGPRSAEALRALEARLASAEAAPAALIEDVVARLGERLADAEARTGSALESLRGSLSDLDERLRATGEGVRAEFEQRLEVLADRLTRRVEDARAEVAERLTASGAGDAAARIDRLAADLAAAEQRSARAIETMGREVLTMAEALSSRVRGAEQRSADAIEQVGGEIARIAGAVETRLSRTDELHAEALERLGAEIGRITERLTDRLLHSERRAAQAIDDVGEQVAKVTERIEQRHERASSDLAERIRASEARTAQLLEDARTRLLGEAVELPTLAEAAPGAQSLAAEFQATEFETTEPEATELEASELTELEAANLETAELKTAEPDTEAPPTVAAAPPEPPVAASIFAAQLFSRAEPISQPALDPAHPAFGAEDFEAVDAFVPLDEPADERLELDPVPPQRATPQLSTREVIEQARAQARAAAATRPATIHAGERRPRPARAGGLFGGLKPVRAVSTWQTALMVAGGAAFLSVGAAGVVLMEGPGVPRQPQQAQPFVIPPRAALALAPQALSQPEPIASPTEAAAAQAAAAADPMASRYLAAVRGVEQRQPGALARLKTLADAGHTPAQVYLARLYETGHGGVSLNLREARRWTERAAEAGDPAAMHNLALYYFRGEGGSADAAAAARWFKQAAEHGVVDSQYNLGLLNQSGSGVPKDLGQAYKWFSIAALGGDSEARTAAADLAARLPRDQLAALQSQVADFRAAGAAPASLASVPGHGPTAAEQILNRLGYLKSRPGEANPRDLKLAVAAYQRDQGLAATGSLDPATVSRLSVFNR